MTDSKTLIAALQQGDQGAAISALRSSPDLMLRPIDDLSDAPREYYPVHVAAFTNQADVLRYLLEQGCDVNLAEPTHKGWTALHFAAQHRHVEVARVLMEFGVDTSLTDEDGRTALDFALEFAHADIVEIIEGR